MSFGAIHGSPIKRQHELGREIERMNHELGVKAVFAVPSSAYAPITDAQAPISAFVCTHNAFIWLVRHSNGWRAVVSPGVSEEMIRSLTRNVKIQFVRHSTEHSVFDLQSSEAIKVFIQRTADLRVLQVLTRSAIALRIQLLQSALPEEIYKVPTVQSDDDRRLSAK